MQKKNKITTVLLTAISLASALTPAMTTAQSSNNDGVNIGFVSFLTGAAAAPFGIPARNAAVVVVEAINAGTVPAPYASAGLGGKRIKPVFIDENSKQTVKDYQNLVRNQGVDMVVGYISSGNCKKIAPVAEQEKVLTMLAICGTPQIFEEIVPNPSYVFRAFSHSTTENVAAARYVLETSKDFSSIAGVNQNYAWGQDSWRDFSTSIGVLKQGLQVSTEQFPKLFAGEYANELSTIIDKNPDIVHSSFWGNDVEALVIQGGVRDVFSRSRLILTAGDTAIHRLGPQIPDGTIMGGRGPTGQLAPDSELNDWFRRIYFQRFGSFPTHPAYFVAQALLGLKAAADKTNSADPELIKTALAGLEYSSPSGKVSMSLANGHQAVTGSAYGSYQYDTQTGKGKLVNIKRYSAECVNPPKGVKSIDWIKSGFKGANCRS